MEDPYAALNEPGKSPQQRSQIAVVLGAVVALAIAGMAVFIVLLSEGEGSPTDVPAGERVEVMFMVMGVEREGMIDGTIMVPSDGEDANTFLPIGSSVSVEWNPDIEIVMGDASDIYEGAIIQANGYYRGNVLVAEQLVVLTDIIDTE